MTLNPASFKDPFGCVFELNGEIYRSVFPAGVKDFESARDEGVFQELVDAGLLLAHEEVQIGDLAPEGTVYCLKHPKLPLISYPWEWSFSMLKEAALVHLYAMEMLLPKGFWLRDASAFNVQYDGNGVRLIDTLSVGRRIPESPWTAYGQFCSHFLAPLAIAAYCDVRMLSLWRSYIDGYPLDLASKMLPFWARYRPGIFMHLILHARAQKMADRKKDVGKKKSRSKPKVSDRGLLGLISSLRRTIKGLNWKPTSDLWDEYSTIRTYSKKDVTQKTEYVAKIVRRLKPKIVWDLGANTGEFSLIAASHGAFVVAIDADPACTEHLYKKIFQGNTVERILPLTMDIANPSPGLGWDSRERLSLRDRGPADLVLALALIHHLAFSCCVPLRLIAEWLSGLTNHLLVEFVPPDDPMVLKLLENRGDEHLPYSAEEFREAFGTFFEFEDQTTLMNGRMLFFYKRR